MCSGYGKHTRRLRKELKVYDLEAKLDTETKCPVLLLHCVLLTLGDRICA